MFRRGDVGRGEGIRSKTLLARWVRAGSVLGLLAVLVVACESRAFRSLQAGRLYTTGTEALDRGDHQTAIAQLEEAATLVPDASEIRNHLGLAYWSAGDSDRARAAFEAAIDLDCDNEAARANLASLDAALAAPRAETSLDAALAAPRAETHDAP